MVSVSVCYAPIRRAEYQVCKGCTVSLSFFPSLTLNLLGVLFLPLLFHSLIHSYTHSHAFTDRHTLPNIQTSFLHSNSKNKRIVPWNRIGCTDGRFLNVGRQDFYPRACTTTSTLLKLPKILKLIWVTSLQCFKGKHFTVTHLRHQHHSYHMIHITQVSIDSLPKTHRHTQTHTHTHSLFHTRKQTSTHTHTHTLSLSCSNLSPIFFIHRPVRFSSSGSLSVSVCVCAQKEIGRQRRIEEERKDGVRWLEWEEDPCKTLQPAHENNIFTLESAEQVEWAEL